MPRPPIHAIIPIAATLAAASLAAAQPEWSADFAGPASGVKAVVAWDEDGAGPAPWALFVAGATDGPTEGQAVVRWDGHVWSALGGGVTGGLVNALALFDDGSGEALYAAGSFKTAGGTPVGGIARWDGASWTPLGAGLTGGGAFNCLTVYDDDGAGPIAPALYAAGWFALVDGKWCKYIARWDGTQWSPVGGGMNDAVYTMCVWDPDGGGPKRSLLVVGGQFREAGGQPAEHVAAWNGKKWQPLGPGANGLVRSLAAYDGGEGIEQLFVGGSFDQAGGAPAVNLARWDNAGWSAVPGFKYDLYSLGVTALKAFDPDGPGQAPRWLYIAGDFDSTDEGPGASFAAWDGAQWQPAPRLWFSPQYLASGDLDGPGPLGDRLLIGGTELAVMSEEGDAAVAVERGVNGENISSLTTLDLDGDGPEGLSLVLTGRFRSGAETPALRIARWDGASFAPFGSGLGAFLFNGEQTDIYDAEVFDPDGPGPLPPRLFASAALRPADNPNGSPDYVLMRWDGVEWTLSADLERAAYDLAVFDEDGEGPAGAALFIGGAVSSVDGLAVNRIARWDGQAWGDMGGGVVSMDNPEYGGFVRALTAFDRDGDGPLPAVLAVGGLFDLAGDVMTSGLALWDGQAWSTIGGVDSDGAIFALATYDADGPGPGAPALVAAGGMTLIGGVQARNIAMFDGQAWSPLGSGVNEHVYALTVYDDGGGPAVVVGGSLQEAGGQAVGHIARWRDGQWSALGSGLEATPDYVGVANALAVYDDDGPGPGVPALYVGGRFMVAGGLSSDCIARWGPPPSLCAADCDASGVLDLFDFLCFVNRFNAADPAADCDGSGVLDLFDFLCFVNAFNDGC